MWILDMYKIILSKTHSHSILVEAFVISEHRSLSLSCVIFLFQSSVESKFKDGSRVQGQEESSCRGSAKASFRFWTDDGEEP